MTRRKYQTLSRYGPTRRTSVSLPAGLVELTRQLAADQAVTGGATTRSAVVADLLERGLRDLNSERVAAGFDPYCYVDPLPLRSERGAGRWAVL